MVVGNLAARFSHHPDIGVVQAPTRTDPVEKKTDLDAGFGPLAERIAELPPNFVRMEDVRGKIHRLLGGSDRLEHRRKICVAIREHLDLVTADRNGIRESEGRAEKLRIPDRETMFEMIFEGVSPDEEETENKDDGEKTEGEPD